jgi:ABC-2 type transport system ATP-binding protein
MAILAGAATAGGQRQRLSVALALIGRPRIAVLDEMTTGLDPQARRDAWGLIEHIRDRGVTIVLVTHFMEEAERLCDRVALIDRGRVVALDTPASLAARARGGKSVRFLPSAPFDEALLTGLPEVSRVEHEGQHVVVTGTGELVNAVILTLAAAGVTARDVQLDSSNLEDAFVKLTGKNLQKKKKEHWHEFPVRPDRAQRGQAGPAAADQHDRQHRPPRRADDHLR